MERLYLTKYHIVGSVINQYRVDALMGGDDATHEVVDDTCITKSLFCYDPEYDLACRLNEAFEW